MISIVSANEVTTQLDQLYDGFNAEWQTMEPLIEEKQGYVIPRPLLALDENKLLGGLAFTRVAFRGSEDLKLWINAVLVAPEYRGRGIASRLIQAAEQTAKTLGVAEIYAYTDIPGLYQKQGWQIADDSGESVVVRRVF